MRKATDKTNVWMRKRKPLVNHEKAELGRLVLEVSVRQSLKDEEVVTSVDAKEKSDEDRSGH